MGFRKHFIHNIPVLVLLSGMLLVSCGGGSKGDVVVLDASSKNTPTVVRSAVVKAIEGCEAGGVEIESGVDKNENGILDDDEVSTTKTICHGISGYDTLVSITDEIPGDNCLSGGKKIIQGMDVNRNVVLDTEEVESEHYLCNGLNGKDGSVGVNTICSASENQDGSKLLSCDDGSSITISDGTNGTDGENGKDGSSCTIKDNGDGVKTLSCTDGTSVTLKDGISGDNGSSCSIINNGDGTKTLQCEDDTNIVFRNEKAILKANLEPVVFSGDTIVLDASQSTAGGLDGQFVSYRWQQINSDHSKNLVINNAQSKMANFIAPTVTKNTFLEFELTASTELGSTQQTSVYTMVMPYKGEHLQYKSTDIPNRVLGHILGLGSVKDVLINENKAYVADGYGIKVIDVNNPLQPQVISELETPGDATAIALVGSLLYVADGNNGLQVIDTIDVHALQLLANIKTPAAANDVVVIGSHAYITYSSFDLFTETTENGLQIIDINNPQSLQLLGNYRNTQREGSNINGVFIVDSRAYLATEFGGLQIVDISDENNPKYLENFNTPGQAMAVVIKDSIAYVADGNAGLRVINLTDVDSAYSVDTNGTAMDIAISESTIYVADGRNGGISVINLNNKQVIQDKTSSGNSQAIAVNGNVAYLADGVKGLQLFDIGDIQAEPVVLAEVAVPDFSHDIEVINNISYVADGTYGLQIVDTSDLHNPLLLSQIAVSGSAKSIDVKDTLAYVSYETEAGKSGILEVDVSTPSAPEIIRDLPRNDSNYAGDITVVGTTAYVASDFNGVIVIDLGDTTTSTAITTSGRAMKLDIVNETLYVANREKGLRVIDINNQESAYNIAVPGGIARDVKVIDNLAYVTDLYGLQIINLNNKQLLYSINTPYAARSLSIVDSVAYVAYDDNNVNFNNDDYSVDYAKSGIQIVDLHGISSGFTPVTLGFVNKIPGVIQSLKVQGKTAYVAAGASGLQLVDLENIQLPVISNSLDISARALGVKVVDSVAYVNYLKIQPDGKRNYGLQLIDVKDSVALELLSNISTPKPIYGLDIVDSLAYIGLGQILQIIDVNDPLASRLVRNYEAPGNVIDINNEPGSFTQGEISDIKVNDNLAYVLYVAEGPLGTDGSGGSGLQIIDVANVKNGRTPEVLSTFAIPGYGQATGLAIADSVAYVADKWGHLHLIDVSNKQSPVLITGIDIPGQLNSVVVEGDIAFLTQATEKCCYDELDSKLFMVDISDKQLPVLLGNVSLPGYVRSGSISGNIAYLAGDVDGLQLIDISDVNSPSYINAFNGPGYQAIDVTVIGDTAYVANLKQGITSNKLPVLANSYDNTIAGETLNYSVYFEPLDILLSPIGKCWVSAGSCSLNNIDLASKTVNFSWQLPDTEGDYEIMLGVGTKDFFFTQLDHVTVLNEILSKTFTGNWKSDLASEFVSINGDFNANYYLVNNSDCESHQGNLNDVMTFDTKQQVAKDGDTTFVLSNNDQLYLINSSGISSYTRTEAVSAECL